MYCDCFVHTICALVTTKKEFTYSKSDCQVDAMFEGGNMVPHENVCRLSKKETYKNC